MEFPLSTQTLFCRRICAYFSTSQLDRFSLQHLATYEHVPALTLRSHAWTEAIDVVTAIKTTTKHINDSITLPPISI